MGEFNIVIVDDLLKENDSFIRWYKKKFPQAEVSLFNKVGDALNFINSNLIHKTIVFMDCKFDNDAKQGSDGLAELRARTSLISVIMMSANSLSQMKNDAVMKMINTNNVYFIRNNDLDGGAELVNKIIMSWREQLDCVLEQWVLDQDANQREQPYIATKTGMVKTLNDLLKDIRNQSPEGIEMGRYVLLATIDLLTNGVKNDD